MMKKIYLIQALLAIFLFSSIGCEQREIDPALKKKIKNIDTLSFHFLGREKTRLKRGSTFFDMLINEVKISQPLAYEITQALKDSVNLRKIKPRDQFYTYWSETGDIKEIIFLPRHSQNKWHMEIVKQDSGRDKISVQKKPVPLESSYHLIKRIIVDNLYNAFVPEFSPDFIYQITDILQWDVDFLTDPRVGDQISVWLEEKSSDEFRSNFIRILGISYFGERDTAIAIYDRVSGRYYDLNGNSVRKTFLKSPLTYRRISSTFSRNRFHPIKKYYRPHNGVDFAAPKGTPISASADGKVVFKGWKNGFGNTLILRHAQFYKTLYGHLLGFKRGMYIGKKIRQGETIGFVGKTGTATGYHLHYTFYLNGRAVDPLKIKSPPGQAIADSLKPYFSKYARLIYEDFLQ